MYCNYNYLSIVIILYYEVIISLPRVQANQYIYPSNPGLQKT